MICPKCGSRDTEHTSDWKLKVIVAECQHCWHVWAQEYNPLMRDKEGKDNASP